MGKPGRKSGRNIKAGHRLKMALAILARNPETAIVDVQSDAEWIALKLPFHPRTIDHWCKTGIPEEKAKIAKVAAFLRISLDTFLSSPETELVEAIKAAWGISGQKKPDAVGVLPMCAQRNCLCETAGKIAQCIEEVGQKWRDAGMPYSLVMKYGECIKLHTQDDEVVHCVDDQAGLALGLLVSLHYSAGWEKWPSLNFSNLLAIEAMLRTFRLHFWRVRFRVLYTLQHVNPELLNNLLKEHEGLLNEQTMIAIREHVSSKTVTRYLRHVAETAIDPNIRKKAMQVLSEISALWNDKSAGIGLPL